MVNGALMDCVINNAYNSTVRTEHRRVERVSTSFWEDGAHQMQEHKRVTLDTNLKMIPGEEESAAFFFFNLKGQISFYSWRNAKMLPILFIYRRPTLLL